jgi:hypothetical protein
MPPDCYSSIRREAGRGRAISITHMSDGGGNGRSGPRVGSVESVRESCSSVPALAKAFGRVLFTPAWWPEDTQRLEYRLDRFPHRTHYWIGSLRDDGVPVGVVGSVELPGARRATGEWWEPSELAHVRGLIGRTGIPPKLQAVVHDEELAIHLIGYATEEEIVKTVNSFQRISPT